MNLEKQKAFILRVIYITLILGLVYVVIKYFLPMLMPFVIGLIIALIFRRLIDRIEKVLHIKRTMVSILILIIFYGILVLLISIIGFKVFTYVKNIITGLPDLYRSTIEPALLNASDNLVLNIPEIEPILNDFIENINESISAFVTRASSTVLGTITGFASQLPSFLIKLLFTIVSSFFFTIDYYRIRDFTLRQFTGKRQEMILKLKDNGIGTLGKFFKAYAVIITITFTEISLGLLILGIPNPFLFGAMIAVVDILPILGTGAVLIPWSIIGFIIGNTKIGIGILLLYIIITVVRQSIEPKIVGQQIGLHPVITLLCMYVGTQLMGVLGLLLLPVIATLLKKLNDEGVINLFK